jgi:hypothetical protein
MTRNPVSKLGDTQCPEIARDGFKFNWQSSVFYEIPKLMSQNQLQTLQIQVKSSRTLVNPASRFVVFFRLFLFARDCSGSSYVVIIVFSAD